MNYNSFFPVCILFLLTSCGLARFAHKTDVDYAATITQEELREHLTIYASDEFAGRDTGTPGGDLAVAFLANNYEEMGLESPDEDYKQPVPLVRRQAVDIDLTIEDSVYSVGDRFFNFIPAQSGSVQSDQVAYVGYGIEDSNYSSYENMDVNGKLVLMKVGEPMVNDSTYLLSESNEATKWSSLRQSFQDRMEAAKKHGASSALLVYPPEDFGSLSASYLRMKSGAGRMSLSKETNEEPFYFLFIDEKLGNKLVSSLSQTNEAQLIKKPIQISYENNEEQISANNVLAHVRGSEFPDEYIVISAHLDHVGTNAAGEIYNGADDDGSGTVAILEIAEAFQQAAEEGHRPKRSILFLHVTGEEKGLLGSRYYTDFDPIIPLENTVSNLNIDMIGRTDPKREGSREYIYLIGSDKLSTELHQLSEQVNAEHTQLALDYTYNAEDDPNRFYYRSDHYNFAKNNIPVIFYFNGTHDDYHQPSDTVDKIEFDLLAERTRLIFYTAWELANREHRIVVDKAPVDK